MISIRNDKKERTVRIGENALNLPQEGFVLDKTKKLPVRASLERHHFAKDRPFVNSVVDNCASKCYSTWLVMRSPFVKISCGT